MEAEVRRFLTSRGPRWPAASTTSSRSVTSATTRGCGGGPGHPCVVLDRGERVDVLLGDRSVDMPAWLRPRSEIRVRRELRPADLAGTLDPQSRLVLCRRLVREGLLEVVA